MTVLSSANSGYNCLSLLFPASISFMRLRSLVYKLVFTFVLVIDQAADFVLEIKFNKSRCDSPSRN